MKSLNNHDTYSGGSTSQGGNINFRGGGTRGINGIASFKSGQQTGVHVQVRKNHLLSFSPSVMLTPVCRWKPSHKPNLGMSEILLMRQNRDKRFGMGAKRMWILSLKEYRTLKIYSTISYSSIRIYPLTDNHNAFRSMDYS